MPGTKGGSRLSALGSRLTARSSREPRADGRERRRKAARGWLVGAFTERLAFKGTAIFLALVLWVVVNAEEPIEDVVPVELVLDHDSSMVLVGPDPVIRAAVLGRARDVTRLYSDPLQVRRSIPPDAGDSVRFELSRVDVLPPTTLSGEVLVRSIEPSMITLRLTTRVQRQVPVRPRARITVDSGWRQVGAVQTVPESVTVVGTRDQVLAVTAVATETVDLRVRDTLGTSVSLDTAGIGARVQPTRVRLRVPVVRDTLPSLPAVVPLGPNGAPPRRP